METKKFSLKEFVISEKFYFWFIVATMAAIPIGELITELYNRPYISQPHILAVSGCIGFVSVLLFFGKNAGSGKFKPYPSDMFFLLLVFFMLMTFLFAGGDTSIIGSSARFEEWVLHYIAYYSLMFAGTMITDDKLRKKTLYVLAAVALFNCLIAFPQSFGITISYCPNSMVFHIKTKAIYGLTKNCNLFAGLSVIFTALCIGMFIFSDKKWKRWAFLALYVLCFYCSIATTARIAWLGNIGVQCFYIISFIVMKNKNYNKEKLKKYVLSWGIIMTASVLALTYFAIFTDILKSGLQETLNDFDSEKSFDAFGSSRGYIWRFALEAIPDNWLFGTGINNFEKVFFSNPRYKEDMLFFDLAANEYIYIALTQGIFSAVNYIAMLVYSCIIGVKTVINTENEEKRAVTWILLGMFAGYAVQAFVNSSVINVAPYFWIVVGMTMPKCDQKPLRLKRKA